MSIVRIGLAQVRQTADLGTNVRTVFRFLDEGAKAGGMKG